MKSVFEAYLELNKQMLLQNMDSDIEFHLSDRDFEMLLTFIMEKFSCHYKAEPIRSIEATDFYKLSGPGGYLTFRRKSRNK